MEGWVESSAGTERKQQKEVPQLQQVIGEIFAGYVKTRQRKEPALSLVRTFPELEEEIEELFNQLKDNDIRGVEYSLYEIEQTLRELNRKRKIEGDSQTVKVLEGMRVFLRGESCYFSAHDHKSVCVIDSILNRVSEKQGSVFFLTKKDYQYEIGGIEFEGLVELTERPQGIICKEVNYNGDPVVSDAVVKLMASTGWETPVPLYWLRSVEELEVDVFCGQCSIKTDYSQTPVSMILFKVKGDNGMPLYLRLAVNAYTQAVELEYAVSPGTTFEEYGWSMTRIKKFIGEYLFRGVEEGADEEMSSFGDAN